ncbi:MAG: hypothetical protein IPM45_16265 [Acidimicrobiales bacterium]|nr:hypothetical protein [Acidimicrobiales bacterium]
MSSPPRPARAALWLLTLGALAAMLLRVGSGGLGAPPASFSGLVAWVNEGDPALRAVALIRLAALAAVAYLAVATVVVTVAGASTSARARAVARATTSATVRRLLAMALGIGVTAVAIGTGPLGPGAPPRPVAAQVAPPVDPSPPGTALLQLLPPAPQVPATPPSGPPAAPAPTTGSTAPSTWTVASGEHVWAVAEQVLGRAWGRPPSDVEIVPYWHALIARNADRIPVPGQPDLLFVGTVLALPAPPQAPAPTGAAALPPTT